MVPMNNPLHGHTGQRIAASQRRSNIEIIADMLRAGAHGAGKTEIMYSANMSYSQIQKYLGFLVNQGFIHKIAAGNAMASYQLTESGLKLLNTIDNLIELLGGSDEEQKSAVTNLPTPSL